MFRSDKLKQILYDMRHQPVVTWVTLAGTALSIFLIMLVYGVQQLNVVPFAPESNRPRLLYGAYLHLASTDGNSESSGELSTSVGHQLYDSIDGVEMTSIFEFDGADVTLRGPKGEIFRDKQKKTDSDFWKIYDHTLLSGRYYTAEEVTAGAKVAVISRSTARRLFGDVSPIGGEFSSDFKKYKVIGVVKDCNRLAERAYSAVFVPLKPQSDSKDGNPMRLFGNAAVVMLVKNGADTESIRRQVENRYAQLDTRLAAQGYRCVYHNQPYTQAEISRGIWSNCSPESENTVNKYGVYLILFLLPAINLGSMLHSRLQRRVGELGIRRAFGCTRSRIVRDIISENFIITLLGGVAGWLCCVVFMSSYSGLFIGPFGADRGTADLVMMLNWRLVLGVFASCFIINIISASIPAWYASRLNVTDAVNGRLR